MTPPILDSSRGDILGDWRTVTSPLPCLKKFPGCGAAPRPSPWNSSSDFMIAQGTKVDVSEERGKLRSPRYPPAGGTRWLGRRQIAPNSDDPHSEITVDDDLENHIQEVRRRRTSRRSEPRPIRSVDEGSGMTTTFERLSARRPEYPS
jgi:hypothetical protein